MVLIEFLFDLVGFKYKYGILSTQFMVHMYLQNSFDLVGFKKDMWYAVDPVHGTKLQTMSLDGDNKICPSASGTSIFIGRTGKDLITFECVK